MGITRACLWCKFKWKLHFKRIKLSGFISVNMVALDSSPAKNHSGADNMLGIKKSKKKKSKKIDTESVQIEVNQIDAAKINAMKEMVNQDDSPKKKKKKKKDKRKEDGEKEKK